MSVVEAAVDDWMKGLIAREQAALAQVGSVRLSNSQRMALCDVLIFYMTRTDQPQEFIDVAFGVTTTTSDLLNLLVLVRP